jgi:NhaP-type Na+/H+ or K+/H+ antiporter
MVETQIHQIDRKTWNKWSFYINIVVFIIIAAAIYLLMLDVYSAGKLASSGSGGDFLSQAWLTIVRDIAFLAIAITYVFFQLFKYQRMIIRRSW